MKKDQGQSWNGISGFSGAKNGTRAKKWRRGRARSVLPFFLTPSPLFCLPYVFLWLSFLIFFFETTQKCLLCSLRLKLNLQSPSQMPRFGGHLCKKIKPLQKKYYCFMFTFRVEWKKSTCSWIRNTHFVGQCCWRDWMWQCSPLVGLTELRFANYLRLYYFVSLVYYAIIRNNYTSCCLTLGTRGKDPVLGNNL